MARDESTTATERAARRATLTIREVAARAGVSASTVSRVLNDSGYVRAEVRARIERVIAETGYVPSGIATNLKRSTSTMVGVVIPRINSFASSEITAGISATLAEAGYIPILGSSANRPENELAYVETFRRQRVDGVLILATQLTGPLLASLTEIGVPVVVIGQDASASGFASVIQDERRATRQITDLLIRSGHRRIGLIGVAEWDIQVGCERKGGYVEALAAAGIAPPPSWIALGGFDLRDGAAGADRLVAAPEPERPTAILAVTDRLAIGAVSRLVDLRIDVPREVSVAGIGDIDVAAVYNPKLTTVRFDYFGTGTVAARTLVAMLRGERIAPAAQVMPFELRVRDSVADRKARA
ncbi:transcriptional regulator, LacI family [Methylobacterium sp. 4-46]|uniref:LacI family DNA-binding transcriptional regulator n=1 Tax=unclassified Methylobacterium TaxID=2615210 RepID=UPI000152E24B|nr:MULTISPECIES: LacI family DNA-binding transcriptional regulator [Methylobacterium]ACA17822.1 transcriptional regulator, LacI family [Methylobacterium sp. 4-46]WFT77128.1 LacI family DNA-binding transcriptional regulator [Methylobacterium nodulans]